MKQGTRLQVPKAEIPAPTRSDQNRGEFWKKIHIADPSRDHGRFISIENELDRAGLCVPDLDIDIEHSFFLFGSLQPRRSHNELIVRTPHAAAQLHFRSALREVYSRFLRRFLLISQCSTVFSHTEKSSLHRHKHAFPSSSDAVIKS